MKATLNLDKYKQLLMIAAEIFYCGQKGVDWHFPKVKPHKQSQIAH